jgi:hypothetical protein
MIMLDYTRMHVDTYMRSCGKEMERIGNMS